MTDSSQNPIRIFLLDHHTLVRAGLRLLIECHPGMKVVGEAGNASEGLEIVSYQKPDIILFDIHSSGDPGLDIIPRLIKTWDRGRLILLTSSEDTNLCLRAVQNGVLGVVTKTQPPGVLLKAIEKVHAGEVWVERSMIANLLTSLSHKWQSPASDPEADRIALLSIRERQVIRLIGQGLKNQHIAAQLCISETTVRHHLTSIYNKLGVSDRLELLVFAHRCGLTKHPDL